MIIMLNGCFGVGKTTTAETLVRQLPDAMLFDPEALGDAARFITHRVRSADEDTDDFQDIAVWRALVISTAEQLLRRYRCTLVVPMTLARPAYLDEIRTGFARFEPRVHHFCLVAPLATIHARLLERGDTAGCWAWRKSAQYAPLLDDPAYAAHLDAERRSPAALAEEILAHLHRSV